MEFSTDRRTLSDGAEEKIFPERRDKVVDIKAGFSQVQHYPPNRTFPRWGF